MRRAVLIIAVILLMGSLSACAQRESNNAPEVGNAGGSAVQQGEKAQIDQLPSENKVEENKPGENASAKPGSGDYQLKKEIFTDKGVKVEYPQMVNYSDEGKQKEINDLIKNEALAVYQDTIKGLEPNESLEVEGSYEIKLKNSHILSIAYSSYSNITPSAHPYNLFYTTNIDLQTGKKLLLADFIPKIDNNFIEVLKKAKYVGEIDKEYEPQLKDQAFGWYGSNQKLMDALSQKGGNNSTFVYVTGDTLGLSMPVTHVAGDHAEFEISISDLKEGHVIYKLIDG